MPKPRITARQREYLLFIQKYLDRFGRAPAETDLQRAFLVSAPSVHQMLVTLERRGLISRIPGRARSIRLQVSAEDLAAVPPPPPEPPREPPPPPAPPSPPRRREPPGQPYTPLREPYLATLAEVEIIREGDTARIRYREPGISETCYTFGPELDRLSDAEILARFNEDLTARNQLAALERRRPAVELPLGQPQMRYSPRCDQWVPRGDVLRCQIGEDLDNHTATVIIDDRELSMHDFGRLLLTYAGWGFRLVFVERDYTHQQPRTVTRLPEAGADGAPEELP